MRRPRGLLFNMFGVQVELDSVKQGSDNSLPACLIKFSVENGITTEPTEICYEFQLTPLKKAKGQQTTARPFIAAYGPAQVTYPANQAAIAESNSTRPASVIAYPTPDGLLVVLRRGNPTAEPLPTLFTIVMVVVHTQDAVLKVIPSLSDRRRARVFKRSITRPIHLDSAAEPGDELNVTCALQEDGTCHPTCDDFGRRHMTLDIWRSFIIRNHLRKFDGDTAGNVSSHSRTCYNSTA